MALKIRCTGCKKKISVDEAFAGGVCRCPYCSEIVNVPGSSDASGGGRRPDEPGGRPEAPTAVQTRIEAQAAARGRPDEPGAAPHATGETPVAPTQAPEHIPLARPVRLQGILSIVFLAGFVIMAAAVSLVLYQQLTRPPEDKPLVVPPPADNPFAGVKSGAASIAGIEITAPVMFVVDGGTSMVDSISYAQQMVRLSLRTLKDQKVNVLLLTEAGNKLASETYLPAAGADEKVKALFAQPFVKGRTDLEQGALEALDAKPATVVLMIAKSIGKDAVARVVARAKEVKAVIHCMILTDGPSVAEAMAELAKQSGGQSKAFSLAELSQEMSKIKDLD